MTSITLPNWKPRPYQFAAWDARMVHKKARRILICHRRWGKDDISLHTAAVEAHMRIGNYWHMLPEYKQGRKAIWNAVNPHSGKRRIDEAFPKELRANTIDDEMLIRFKNGSTWQVVGSDNYDTNVGVSVIGMAFSEYALSNPAAWAYMQPVLAENGGYADFITTPRGRNHAFKMYNLAKESPEQWYAELAPVSKTKALPAEILKGVQAEYVALYGQDDGMMKYLQEYECSFDASLLGSYYGSILARMEKEGRMTFVPHDPSKKVWVSWDLGVNDQTALWFFQRNGSGWDVINYYAGRNQGLPHYVQYLNALGYNYAGHIVPHDTENTEWATGQVRVDTMKSLGLTNIKVAPKISVIDGINATRQLLPRLRFDATNCDGGLEALRNYQREWDEDLKTFKDKPLHDWASDGSDSMRYFAVCEPKNEVANDWSGDWFRPKSAAQLNAQWASLGR